MTKNVLLGLGTYRQNSRILEVITQHKKRRRDKFWIFSDLENTVRIKKNDLVNKISLTV